MLHSSGSANETSWLDLPPLAQEQLVSHHLPDPLDINALARTCQAMRSMMRSPTLQAAWLWKRKGDGAIWEATHRCTDATQRLSVLRQLVEVHHADINIEMGLVLHWACCNGHVDMVSYISMQPDIRINFATYEKQVSPLHVACCSRAPLMWCVSFSATQISRST